ncbi:MucR family transcriptional regulator [Enterovirga sp.]|uniref:MucR family transcriptional regulator n=1 Tax=Enterovirga sp. TaxID=2026350 RepID=UPI002BBDC118|nr:MucR family transcriptional regulator [Enterovirga sp.]HMO31073.1 MucR family transcriptional regulator [Enterovirga sp.]
MSEAKKPDLTTLTVQLLSAYVGNNTIASSELADLARTTRAALSEGIKPASPPEPVYVGAVSTRASIASRDHIFSMIDGKSYKSLKHHLSKHGLSPAEYRTRYKLAADYPMVAPGYSEQRREVAKTLGLGRKKAAPAEVIEAPKAKRGTNAKRGAKSSEAQAAE